MERRRVARRAITTPDRQFAMADPWFIRVAAGAITRRAK